jgi:hypothetical protein
MKKLIFSGLLIVLLIVLLPIMVSAAEITKTFAWDEPSDLEVITQWELHWSATQGGPYAKMIDIPRDGDYTEPITVDITGPPATNQTRYFVLRACGDVVQEDASTLYECSETSNEASLTVWVPANQFQVPINFRVLADPD